MKEKHIEGYIVYEDGSIYSLHRHKFLTPYRKPDGYEYVKLSNKGKSERWYVHRLVAKCFLDPVEGKTYVNHKDHCRWNNHVDNLEWVTQSENQYKSFEHENGARKHKEYKFVFKGEVITVINLPLFCKERGLDNGHMTRVASGIRKSHKGFTKY